MHTPEHGGTDIGDDDYEDSDAGAVAPDQNAIEPATLKDAPICYLLDLISRYLID